MVTQAAALTTPLTHTDDNGVCAARTHAPGWPRSTAQHSTSAHPLYKAYGCTVLVTVAPFGK